MPDSIATRILLAHLELNARLGRKVTQAELGAIVAERMGRGAPFTAAAVSRWETGSKLPGPVVIEAIAAATDTDPGWISHGSRTMAPAPRLRGAAGGDPAATGAGGFPARRGGPQIVS